MKKIFTIVACLCALGATAQIAEVSAPRLVTPTDAAVKARFSHNTKTAESVSVRTEGSTLFITKNGVEKSYSPVDCYAGYICATVSPDGTKVAFVAGGKGLVVCDINGNILSMPGKRYDSPSWFGNQHLVVENPTDDGHQISTSQILLISADGKEKQALTEPESMSMDPVGDINANRVFFTTIDGIEYEQTVTLK